MAIYTPLTKTDIQQIAKNYQLKVSDFKPIAAGNSNSNFILQTQQGKVVLTLFEELQPERVRNIVKILKGLLSAGFSDIKPFDPISGDAMTIWAKKPVLLRTYIEGEVYQELKASHLNQVGKALAQLHEVPIPAGISHRHHYEHPQFASVIGTNKDPEYETWLHQRLVYLEAKIPDTLPRGLIHGDLFFDNVLFKDEKFRAIIDYEDACGHDKILDIGMAILGLCVRKKLSLKKARALLKGYQKIRYLEKSERESLQLFTELAAVRTSNWRFWKYHFQSPIPERVDYHRQMMAIAQSIEGIPHEVFMKAIA